MSWFESTSIASIAKNAIKEAQKTIDKALDIKDEHNEAHIPITTTEGIKPSKISLKEESENFFENFEANEDEKKIITDSPSNVATATSNMVGSIWGSFSESFFENQKGASKDKASASGVTSVSVNKPLNKQVVATQPPHSISGLSDSGIKSVTSPSSKSSTQLSNEDISTPSSIDYQSISEETEEAIIACDDKSRSHSIANDAGGGGWEWGWDSNSLLTSSGFRNEDSIVPKINTSNFEEESLADDAIDPERFSRSRLIVESVDSDTSLNRRESRSSFNSSKSIQEDQSLPSEEVFCDQVETSSNLLKKSSQGDLTTVDSQLDSPDSIVVLDSHPTSPLTLFARDQINVASGNPDSSLNSSESIEVLSTSNSLASPSSNSIEVLSPSSLDDCSSVSDTFGKSSDQPSVNGHKNFTSIDEQETSSEKTWSEEISETGATITKQPIAVSKLHHQDTQDSVDDLEACEFGTPVHSSFMSAISEEGSTSESVHSASTSSTVTIVDVTGAPENLPLSINEISEREDCSSSSLPSGLLDEKFESLEPTSLMSMNAGDIRKNLDRVDKKSVSDTKTPDSQVKMSKEEPTASNINNLLIEKRNEAEVLERSSRSESSTETITTSIDSQLMTWSDLAVLEVCPENLAKPVEDLLEEAISDDTTEKSSSKEEQEHSDSNSPPFDRELSPSSSDRSDPLKFVSSGHSSADEVETATSSDIEVISSPSIDGSNNGTSRTFNMPPSVASKVWMTAQKGLRTFVDKPEPTKRDHHAHERGETVSSSMTTSFTSISESDGDCHPLPHSEMLQLEASRITQVLLQDINIYGKGHRRNQSNMSETSESSSEPPTPETERLWKKITKLTDVLEARETKVLELSHSNISLQEANLSLKNRVEELEGLKMGSEATESVREEFTQRLVTMERKFQQALREKETMKKQLEEYRTEAASRRSNADVVRDLSEKDTIISELRHEGEKLSKQQLNYSNITKKLRAKEKETDACIKDQKEKIDSQSSELDRLRKQLNAKEEVERRQIEAIRLLTITHQKQEVQLKDLGAENAETESKLVTLKEALDSAYREIAELQRSAASKNAEIQEQALSTEVAAREKIEAALAQTHKENMREKETLFAQILELKDDLNRYENQANRKERMLKAEINDLQQRLVEAESRTDEISSSVSEATRPLLRQMEHLHSSHSVQQATWDSLEDSLTRRLNDAQTQLTLSAKKEREAKEQQSVAINSMVTLQSQMTSLQAENSSLKSKLEELNFNLSSLKEDKSKESNQLEALKTSFADEISEVKRERDILEQQLDIEKLALNSEKKKVLSLQDQIKEKDKKMTQLQLVATSSFNSRTSSPRSSPTPSLSRLSVSGSVNESLSGSHWGDDVFESSWMKGSTVYDTLRGNNAATVEVLTSSLRQREGELHQLQTELLRQEAQKDSLAQELVKASRTTEEMTVAIKELEHIKQLYKNMEQKYNALLQMYGEKVEEVDELRLDLSDVKEMYKLQIDELLQK